MQAAQAGTHTALDRALGWHEWWREEPKLPAASFLRTHLEAGIGEAALLGQLIGAGNLLGGQRDTYAQRSTPQQARHMFEAVFLCP